MASNAHNLDEDMKEILTCKICSKIYTKPQTLPCSHSFCENCLASIQEPTEVESIACPECPIVCKPDDLVDYPLLHEYLELYSLSQMSEKGFTGCNMCESTEYSAMCQCVQCKVPLCCNCKMVHQNTTNCEGHIYVPVTADTENCLSRDYSCSFHSNRMCETFCSNCKVSICSECTSKDHAGHIVKPIQLAMEHMVIECQQKLTVNEIGLEQMNKELNDLEQCFNNTKRKFEQVKQNCKDKKDMMVAEMEQWYTETTKILEEVKVKRLSHLKEVQGDIMKQAAFTEQDIKITKAIIEIGKKFISFPHVQVIDMKAAEMIENKSENSSNSYLEVGIDEGFATLSSSTSQYCNIDISAPQILDNNVSETEETCGKQWLVQKSPFLEQGDEGTAEYNFAVDRTGIACSGEQQYGKSFSLSEEGRRQISGNGFRVHSTCVREENAFPVEASNTSESLMTFLKPDSSDPVEIYDRTTLPKQSSFKHFSREGNTQSLFAENSSVVEPSLFPWKIRNLDIPISVVKKVIKSDSLAEYELHGYPHRLACVNGDIWIASSMTLSGNFQIYNTKTKKMSEEESPLLAKICAFVETPQHDVIAACGNGLGAIDFQGRLKYKLSRGNYSDVCVYKNMVFAIEFEDNEVHMFKFVTNRWQRKHSFDISNDDERPKTIYVDDFVYVCANFSVEIYKYTLSGKLIDYYKNAFHGPSICGCDSKGALIVCDALNDRLTYMHSEDKWKDIETTMSHPWDFVVCKGYLYLLSGAPSKILSVFKLNQRVA